MALYIAEIVLVGIIINSRCRSTYQDVIEFALSTFILVYIVTKKLNRKIGNFDDNRNLFTTLLNTIPGFACEFISRKDGIYYNKQPHLKNLIMKYCYKV
jgi:hypothetical protein